VVDFRSPFLEAPKSAWLCSNELAFAIFDGFPVSPGHVLVVTNQVDNIGKTVALYKAGQPYQLPATFLEKLHGTLGQRWSRAH
jgi:hypothetical protein